MRRLLCTFGLAALLAGPAFAGEWLWTNPADGAQRNARGPGIHVDAFGRAYTDSAPRAWLFAPVRPNAYGLGTDSDALGRPSSPEPLGTMQQRLDAIGTLR